MRRGKTFTTMADLAEDEVRIGSRDEERFAVGAVIEAQGRPGRFLLQVDDLSLTGARIRCPSHRIEAGEWLQLDLALAPQRACVVWINGIMAGCEFAEPLQPVVLRIILKALTPKPEELGPVPHHSDTTLPETRFYSADQPEGERPYIPRHSYPPRDRKLRV